MIGQRFLFAFGTIGGINLADHFLKHMRKLISLIVKAAAVCLCVAGLALPGLFAAPFDRGKLAEIDAEIAQAIAETNLPGAVLWIEHKTIRFHKAYGNRATLPKTEAMTEETLFDLASLTKVIAITAASMFLMELIEVKLGEPLCEWIADL